MKIDPNMIIVLPRNGQAGFRYRGAYEDVLKGLEGGLCGPGRSMLVPQVAIIPQKPFCTGRQRGALELWRGIHGRSVILR
jgi:hypothetical protein